jgi:hypothetical protein
VPLLIGQTVSVAMTPERLEIEFNQMLDAFAECFRQGDCRFQLPTVRGALTAIARQPAPRVFPTFS